jgi:hypothetical protein
MRFLSGQSFDTLLPVITAATGTTLLFDKDATRVGGSIFNKSTAILTILAAGSLDAVAADTAMTAGKETVEIAAGGYFELDPSYKGAVYGRWATADGGSAKITLYR